jgi:hypothetical protein
MNIQFGTQKLYVEVCLNNHYDLLLMALSMLSGDCVSVHDSACSCLNISTS